jgi:hypothetical protein
MELIALDPSNTTWREGLAAAYRRVRGLARARSGQVDAELVKSGYHEVVGEGIKRLPRPASPPTKAAVAIGLTGGHARDGA